MQQQPKTLLGLMTIMKTVHEQIEMDTEIEEEKSG